MRVNNIGFSRSTKVLNGQSQFFPTVLKKNKTVLWSTEVGLNKTDFEY